MLEAGRIVGSWQIEAHVGSGGMAEVYRVRHTLLGSVHALKVLRPELAAHEDVRRRFLTEGRLQAQLRHPHLIAVTDVVAEQGVAALVMDFLPGGNLEERLAAGPLAQDRALALLRDVLSALQMLHARGIVHRDLKPANLLFRDAGWDGVVLVDLGVARVLEEDGATRTRTGVMLGTPAYMSPEQVVGRPVDPRSDVFSAGTLAYELLSGQLPFDGDSEFATMQAIVDGRRAPLAERAPGVAPGVAAAVERALSPAPGDRPASAGALWDLLEAGARGIAQGATPAPAREVPPAARAAAALGVPGERAAPRSGGGCVRFLLWTAGLTVATAGAGAAGLLWLGARLEEADRLAAEAVEALRVFKTDPLVNTQSDVLDGAAATAARAVQIWERPEGLGAVALAETWREGWHLVGASWDAARYTTARGRVERALAAQPTEAAAAADVLLQAAACRLSEDEATREAGCAAIASSLARFQAVARGDRWDWLRAEVVWQAVAGERARIGRDGAEAGEAAADVGERLCHDAADLVPSAPVNGRYLAGACLGLLGAAGRYEGWLALGDELRAWSQRQGGDDRWLVELLYTTANPACGAKGTLLAADVHGRPLLWSGTGEGGWGDWCVYLGRHAEGCPDAGDAVPRQRCGFTGASWFDLGALTCTPVREDGVPWDAAVASVEGRGALRARCALR